MVRRNAGTRSEQLFSNKRGELIRAKFQAKVDHVEAELPSSRFELLWFHAAVSSKTFAAQEAPDLFDSAFDAEVYSTCFGLNE